MQDRTARALIGILVLVCFGLALSVVYPFATSDPAVAAPEGDGFTVRTDGAYSATGTIVADGEVRLAIEGVVTPNGAWYQRVVEEHVTAERYSPAANATVYEPRAGWYESAPTYRITGATGEVHVDTETRTVLSASVSWAVTSPAGSYAEYVLASVMGDEPTTRRITYELDRDDHDLERPSWVDDAA